VTQYTAPDDLPIPESTDVVAALEGRLSDLATATQIALSRPGTVASAAERDATYPSPTQGQRVYRTDKGWNEAYFTTPTVRVAGWYPIDGATPAYSATPVSGTWPSDSLTTTMKTLQLITTPTVNRGFTVNNSAGTITIQQSGLYSISVSARGTTTLQVQWMVGGTTVQATKNTDIFNNLALSAIALTAGDVFIHQAATLSGGASTTGTQHAVSITYLGPA
jgi:hypothetical protein